MAELRELQRAFAEALLAPTLGSARLDMLAGHAEAVRRRFGFYRGNVQANRCKALAGAYPVVAQLVGGDFFGGLARAYAVQHPSGDGDLNLYGERFPDFIASFEHAAGVPYLADVAALEWRVHRAYFAADAGPLGVQRLASVAPQRYGDLRLRLHPACALLASDWPVATIWAVHQPEHEGEMAVELDAGGEHALVLRPQWHARVLGVDAASHAFLAACLDGQSLGAAVERALQRGDFPLDARLAAWIADAVIVDFEA
jgi:hypothetical protein